jgi:N-sulfoglucosamine sulfohydrolase
MTVSRRRFLAQVSAAVPLRVQASRPNILFAIADDRSWPGAFATRNQALQLPTIERIEREGVRFDNSFCASPSCTPSRSAVLTGRHQWQVQEGGVLYGTLRPEYPVFTHLLEDAGYHVGSTAKSWGPGIWTAAGQTRPPAGRVYDTRRLTPPNPGIDDRDYAANFDDFLAARKAEQPFFFWYGGTEPHRAYTSGYGRRLGKKIEDVDVPPFWPDTEVVRNDLLDYCAEVEWFDSHLGRMLRSLERIGELDNTMVVVTSDNGMPFPRAKVNLYDWGVHMPLSIRWGGKIPANKAVRSFVHHIDFAPTFLEAAGVKPPASMTGRSIAPLFQNEDPQRDCSYSGLERHVMARPGGATYPVRSIRTHDFLYLRNFKPNRYPTGGSFISSNRTPHGDVDACPTATLLTDPGSRKSFARQYDLCYRKRPAEELYDLKADPWQVNNLAAKPDYRARKEQLWSRLSSYLRQTGDPRIEGRDPWQDYVYHQTVGFGASFNRSLPADQREKARDLARHKPE